MNKTYLNHLKFFLILLSLVLALNAFIPILNFVRPFLSGDWVIGGGGREAKLSQYARQYGYIFSWVIPGLVVICFAYFSRLKARIVYNWPSWILVFIGALAILIIASRYLASAIPGGGGSFALNAYLSYISFPHRVLLLVGAVGFFMSLKRKHES